ncbi:variable surface protein [Plasmodium gonderi]|uniref:Variable surface protein n=1 Tax=Plasmodium gonderi TaxID=77519 RepID=A0A1Y1JQW9_PLAGO|nr:variable surface protein [Plasmodium gonderi]GAW84630.1 variable surface protein [Plasmodium gonderi]
MAHNEAQKTFNNNEYLIILIFDLFLTFQTFDKTNLPSAKFYDVLDKNSMGLNVPYCKGFSNSYGTKGQIKNLCIKYINYLRNQEKIWSNFEYIKRNCNIFTFWLYDKLSISLNMDAKYCSNALSEINLMWTKTFSLDGRNNKYKCNPYHDIQNYHYAWENAKKLFDYSINFDYINSIKSNSKENCDKLCEYLSDIADIYIDNNKRCNHNAEHMCPGLWNEYEKYNPKDLLVKFNCHDDVPVLDIDVHDVSEGGRDGVPEKETEGGLEKGTEGEPDEGLEESPDGEEFHDIPEDGMVFQDDAQLLHDESNTLGTFGNSLLGLVLSSMLLGVLYNFTPLGRIFQNKFPNVAYMINNLSHKGKRLSNHRSDTYSPFREYLEENYIRYDPV